MHNYMHWHIHYNWKSTEHVGKHVGKGANETPMCEIVCASLQYFSCANLCEIAVTSGDASPLFTLCQCSLDQEELMSSGGTHRSSGVSTLNHNTLPVVGRQWRPSHCPSPPPGFQLNSYLLFHNQQEDISAASFILRAAAFFSFPVIPIAVSILHTD